MSVSLCQFQSINEQLLEIVFDAKHFSSGRPRKGWWVEDNYIKFLAFPCQSRQHRHYIVRDEPVIYRWQAIQRKILASPRQRLLRKINVESGCSYICCADRKRAGIGKTVQQPRGRNMAHVAAIFALIQKQSRGIARPEIDSELQMPLGGDRL